MSRKQPTAAQIEAALDALGLRPNPVQDAWIKADGTIVLLLVPNAEPVEYRPKAKTKAKAEKSGD